MARFIYLLSGMLVALTRPDLLRVLSSGSSLARRRVALAILTAAVVPTSLAVTRLTGSRGAQARPPVTTFRSNVDLVRLSVTARNAGGQIVHDLRREDFAVYDDGVAQELSHFAQHESPITVVVLLDRSGSMHGEKMMHAVDGIEAVLKALRPQDEALLTRDGRWREIVVRTSREGVTLSTRAGYFATGS